MLRSPPIKPYLVKIRCAIITNQNDYRKVKMGKEISLFQTYKQGENAHTNYTMLLLKMIYEYSINEFEELITNLIADENLDISIGINFIQQEKRGNSTPDALITQKAFNIVIETKNTVNNFSDDQLEKHLKSMADGGNTLSILLALSNSDGKSKDFSNIINLCEKAGVKFVNIDFENLLAIIKGLNLSPYLISHVNDYESYLNQQNLLPTWKYRLDVVNCTKTMELVEKWGYVCPAQDGSYNHKRSKYFGAYQDKAVRLVAEIKGVVDFYKKDEYRILWKNDEQLNKDALKEEAEKIKNSVAGNFDKRVFVLDKPTKINFTKKSFGGMQCSKRYFDLRDYLENVPDDVEELAEKLNNCEWQ